MGNTTVTPAKSRAPIIPTAPPISYTPVSTFNPNSPTIPIYSSIPPQASYSPTSAVPVPYTTIHIPDVPTIPVTSPTVSIPVVSPTLAVPVISSSPVIPHETSIPIVSPIAAIPIGSPTIGVPVNSPIPVVPVLSSTPEIPIVFPTTTASVNSPTPVSPSGFWTPEIPIASPPPPPPVVPVVSSSPEIPKASSISNINGFPVVSPDTSAVSPTLDPPVTTITSPTPTNAVIPIKSIISQKKIRLTAFSTNEVSTSPLIPVKLHNSVISTTSHPTKGLFAPQQTISKNPTPSSTSTHKQTQPSPLSSVDQWNKWNQSYPKREEKYKILTDTTEQTQSFKNSSTSSLSGNINADQEIIPVVPNIIAVPSFSLRSTAVSNPFPDDHLRPESTQSIHTDVSIFKYHLTYNEKKQSVGNHTKATMFNMNTRLKETPLPTSSLSFLTTNLTDDTHETNDNSTIKPTLGSVGIYHDLQTEPIDPFSTELRLHEKQQEQNFRRSSLLSNGATDSNNSIQFVSSTVMSQPNFSTIEKPSIETNRQPLTTILKKPSPQFNNNPFSTQTNHQTFQQFQKTDSENNPSMISFNFPRLPSKKASQSISRSKRILHRKT